MNHAEIARKLQSARFLLECIDNTVDQTPYRESAEESGMSIDDYLEAKFWSTLEADYPYAYNLLVTEGQHEDQSRRMKAFDRAKELLRAYLGPDFNSVLTDALNHEKVILDLRNSYNVQISYLYTKLVEKLGPALKDVYAVRNHQYYLIFQQVGPCLRRSASGDHEIDPERLTEHSTRYAQAVIDSALAKIKAKLGYLDRAAVVTINGGEFIIDGYRDGDRVTLHQHVIINTSSKGKLFNQFPARIAVNGRFISAAAFKKRFGL